VTCEQGIGTILEGGLHADEAYQNLEREITSDPTIRPFIANILNRLAANQEIIAPNSSEKILKLILLLESRDANLFSHDFDALEGRKMDRSSVMQWVGSQQAGNASYLAPNEASHELVEMYLEKCCQYWREGKQDPLHELLAAISGSWEQKNALLISLNLVLKLEKSQDCFVHNLFLGLKRETERSLGINTAAGCVQPREEQEDMEIEEDPETDILSKLREHVTRALVL
jgi:hypothetical protein